MTITPLPLTTEYGIVWTLKKGNAVYNNSNNIFDEEQSMERDENGIPLIPKSDNTNDDNEEGEDQETHSWFHTNYKWNNVEISYGVGGSDTLKNFEVEAKVYSVRNSPPDPDDPTDTETKEFLEFTPFRVKSATIKSDDPNSGGTWIFPDDYDVVVDANHPKQYGGVVLFTKETPVDKEQGEKFVCGIDDGPEQDGVILWLNSVSNRTQKVISAYNYVDVFDDVKFGYIPRNSYENKEMTSAETFQFQPLYESVRDANGLHAPIYPMNAITAFLPDGRDAVTVTYTVTLDIVPLNNKGEEIENPIKNPSIKIKQKVEQNTNDYIKQLEELGTYCQFQNPRGWSKEELSPNYNYDYPYTLVSGFDGVSTGKEPKTRGDDRNKERLQRGDVWYDPSTFERKIWNIADIPERLVIINRGSGYRDFESAITIKAFETDKSFDEERYPMGRPPRNYNVMAENPPAGLLVNIKTKDGGVTSASISSSSAPSGWKDGDVIRVVGGNNDAEIRIHIDDPPGWSDKFIDKY